MTSSRARFERLLDFPTLFVFRVVGVAREGFSTRCAAVAQEVIGRRIEALEVRPSSNGTYCSVRLGVMALSADELRAIYDALGKIDGVRLVL